MKSMAQAIALATIVPLLIAVTGVAETVMTLAKAASDAAWAVARRMM